MQELAGAGVRIEPDMRLADAGLDSLDFAELAAALERDLGVDLSLEPVYGTDRIDDVVRAVERAPTSAGRTALPRAIGSLQGPADVLGGWALQWWFRLRVEGAGHVPQHGPAVVAMNHESALDIPLVVAASRRRITFMAKKELFKNGFASWSLHSLGAFRVDRDQFDLVAVQRALAVLELGRRAGYVSGGNAFAGSAPPVPARRRMARAARRSTTRALLDLGHGACGAGDKPGPGSCAHPVPRGDRGRAFG